MKKIFVISSILLLTMAFTPGCIINEAPYYYSGEYIINIFTNESFEVIIPAPVTWYPFYSQNVSIKKYCPDADLIIIGPNPYLTDLWNFTHSGEGHIPIENLYAIRITGTNSTTITIPGKAITGSFSGRASLAVNEELNCFYSSIELKISIKGEFYFDGRFSQSYTMDEETIGEGWTLHHVGDRTSLL